MRDIMIDNETLGLETGAAVIQVGLLHFDAYGDAMGSTLDCRVGLAACHEYGLDVEPNTLQWWLNENSDLFRQLAFPQERLTLDVHLSRIDTFINKAREGTPDGRLRVWAQGTTFDISKLEFLYKVCKMSVPWHFTEVCDSRTIFTLNGDKRRKNELMAHDAVNDCIMQAQGLQRVLGTRDKESD